MSSTQRTILSSDSTASKHPSSFLEVVMSSPFDYTGAKEYTNTLKLAAFVVSMIYMATIFGIKIAMESRKPYQIKLSLQVWNLWLAVFSIVGSLISGYALLVDWFRYGLVSTYSIQRDFFEGTSGLMAFLFCISKFAELGDTIFIVLRKRPLIFLHWYHHVATLNYGIMSYSAGTAYNTWIVWLNFTVHSVMYTYYFLAACGIRLPAWFSQCLTTSQIVQFLITLAILAHVAIKMALGERVDTTMTNFAFCLIMEISYVILFGNFFFQSYIKGGGKKFNKEKAIKEKQINSDSLVANSNALKTD